MYTIKPKHIVILIVVVKETFALGDFAYGLLLGALLSVADFLFNKVVNEDDKNKNKNYPKSNKAVKKRK